MSNQRNVQSQATSAGSNPDGSADSTEMLIYYYLQGISLQSEQSKLALRDRNVEF